jgi:hypothetical protein
MIKVSVKKSNLKHLGMDGILPCIPKFTGQVVHGRKLETWWCFIIGSVGGCAADRAHQWPLCRPNHCSPEE